MNALLGFAPFILFAVLTRVTSVELSLAAAAAVAVLLIVRDRVRNGRSAKIIEAGSAVLFGGLALYTAIVHADWSIPGVRLAVDAGVFTIVAFSMLIRVPFTLQYARESVPAQFWTSPQFMRINYAITGVWAATFALHVFADLLMIQLPEAPLWIATAIIVGSLAGAAWFTQWYPQMRRRLAAAQGIEAQGIESPGAQA